MNVPAAKRSRSEKSDSSSDVEAPHPSCLLSQERILALSKCFNKQRDTLLSWFGNEKLSDRKAVLREAIQDMCDAFYTVVGAYNSISTANEVASAFNNVVNKLHAQTKSHAAEEPMRASFANVVSRAPTRPATSKSFAEVVSLPRAEPFVIPAVNSLILGPRDPDSQRFNTSAATKDALLSSIDPVSLGLNIRRIRFAPKQTVIVEGDAASLDKLAKCDKLADAGLETKASVKLKPRIIIHDIPVELTGDEIRQCIVQQNLPSASPEDIRIVYIYPSRTKKFRSSVVEVTAESRSLLFNKGRVNIKWCSCRLDDHISLVQCFNCAGFGHVASACKSAAKCNLCAEQHLPRDCPTKTNLRCANCLAAKLKDLSHSALNKAKCPILRGKIQRLISNIDYGK